MAAEKVIELSNVVTTLGGQPIHRGISFSVERGEMITLLGPSGSGKTLLLKIIIGLMKPTSGDVVVLGHHMQQLKEVDACKVRSSIGMLFQGAALFDSLSIFENVAYGLRERGEKDEARIQSIVHEALSVIGLPEVTQKLPSQLSGGQKKRVGLARALATGPQIMLYDEPTTGLDPTSTRMIDDLISKLHKEHGMTGIAVTHDIASARRFSSRWLLLKDGVIVADGKPEDLERSSELVKSFTHGEWNEE
jgi:phospholipid/cholesterol/gamma-HCH transport system ATP-binding protein